ncbi:retrovirus-related pol polyprotein from transposon TNT 1-94 [Tanacetum coccineum]
MTKSTSVTEHVNNLNTLLSQLPSLDCKIEPQECVKILLQSLPDSYEQVIINLISNVLADYLVFDDVAAVILEKENRRNNREDMQTSSRQVEALVVTRGRSMEHGSSGSHNHGNIASTSDDGNALCCEAAVSNEGRKRFADADLYSCNDHELKIIEIGSIIVKMHDDTVYYLGCATCEGLEKELIFLWDNWMILVLKGEIMEEAEASVASHSPSHRVTVTWHQKLGHMSEHEMKILVERKLLPGLTKVFLPFCEHCVINKQHRLKFKISNFRSVCVLELVQSDVWQASVQSLGGAKYFVLFIDDYSWRCWVYPIKKKSDVFEVLKVYKAQVELDSGKKIKCLRTDNGGEYTSDEFDTFCRQEGIKRQFTTTYNPQQNGVAERMNRTLLRRMEKEFQSNDSFEVLPQHEVNETNESQAPTTRTLNHERKRPRYVVLEGSKQEEIEALHKNKTWELVPLPGGRKPIGNKWVYKIKRNGDDQVERYHERLVVKGYAQKEGIDFNEIFSLVV